jgi:hypothetical protein
MLCFASEARSEVTNRSVRLKSKSPPLLPQGWGTRLGDDGDEEEEEEEG